MEGSAAARGEGSSEEKRETAPLEESASAISPPISSAISAEEHKDYEERGNFLAIRQDKSPATITTARTTELRPSLEEKIAMIRVVMSADKESRQILTSGISGETPTTQVEFSPGGESARNEGSGVPTAEPKSILFPYRKNKRMIKPKTFRLASNGKPVILAEDSPVGRFFANPASNRQAEEDFKAEVREAQLGDELDLMLQSGASAVDSNALTPPNGDDDMDYGEECEDIKEEGADDDDANSQNNNGTQEDDDNKGSNTDGSDVLDDDELDGSVQGRISQPVVTQQIIMDLIMSQQPAIIQPPRLEGEGWEEKKKNYTRLLDGYESPTGGTFRATLELGSLMFAAVAAESANQISLMAQHDANEKLVKQAERHREIMEKEFTENLARIKLENHRAIDETIRIRDEFVQMCKPKISVENDYLRRVDDNQSPEVVRLQLDFMRKKADRCANELRELEERHEQELAQEKALNSIKDHQELLRERKKVKELQATIRNYEENLLGLQPAAKKIKVEDQGLIKAVAMKDQDVPTQEKVTAAALEVKTRAIKDLSSDKVITSAYAQSSHHQRNLDIVLKKDTSDMMPTREEVAELAKSVQII
jgi:hypothetical protein